MNFSQEDSSMTRDELRAAGRRICQWHKRFAGLFGRKESQGHSEVYVRGLMSDERRKNVEAIALRFAKREDGTPPGEKEVVALQGFITVSPWEWGMVQREIQAVFAEELVPSTSQWSIGTVGVIDESAMVKRGTESVGVARQYCGRLGKIENCQVGVYLVGVTPAGVALLDDQLFLPEDWVQDRERRKKTHVPEEITFKTKPEIAAEMIGRTREAGQVTFSWIIGDDLYGVNGNLLDALEDMNQRYLMEVHSKITVWTEEPGNRCSIYLGEKQRKRSGTWRHPAIRSVKELAKEVPLEDWEAMQLREGTKGPLVYEYARVRVWAIRHGKIGIPIWLVFQRSLDGGELKYYVSNADEETSLEEMALVTGTRYRVEEYFEDCKSHLGMAHYETRAWTSWHHHMSLVALAHLYVTLTKLEMKREIPDFTLDMAVRVLRSAFARGELTVEEAMSIIDYHRRRNRIANDSHRKSWLRKHKHVKAKVLL
jgi:SRSO17 transposase